MLKLTAFCLLFLALAFGLPNPESEIIGSNVAECPICESVCPLKPKICPPNYIPNKCVCCPCIPQPEYGCGPCKMYCDITIQRVCRDGEEPNPCQCCPCVKEGIDYYY